jgi:hypothetical protein
MALRHILHFLGIVTLIVVTASLQPRALAAQHTLYVSPTGNDENPGSQDKPFASIDAARRAVQKLNANMTDNIVVEISGGTYQVADTIRFDARDSGTNGHHVVYRAKAGQEVVLSGGTEISNGQPDVDGRWQAATNIDNFRQLYVDGQRAVRARGPELNSRVVATDELEFPGLSEFELYGDDGYKTTSANMADWKNQGDVEFCYYDSWSHSRCKVVGIKRDGDVAIVTMLQPHFLHARGKEGVHVDLPSYLENAMELLDEPGEWYLDRSSDTVYYLPKPGQDLTKSKIVVPNVERLVELRGTLDEPVENIQFVGITFADATWLRPSEIGLVDVQANFAIDWENPMRRSFGILAHHNELRKSPANIVCHKSNGLRFERCTFTRLGGAGIDLEFGAQNNEIVGCHFFDISGSAIQIGDVLTDDHHPDDDRKVVRNNVVANNYIHDCGVEYMSAVGVFAGYTDGTVIAHNEICRMPYSSISVGWGWGEEDAGGGSNELYMPFKYSTATPSGNNRIEYNHLHHISQKMGDGGGVYTLGNMAGTVIRGNYIHDNKQFFGGIYLDMGSGFIEVTGNVVNNVVVPMYYNNKYQNRHETCNEHDNCFDCKLADHPKFQQVIDSAGIEPQYRDLIQE